MSSGEQANQQPPAIENFLIVAYRSLRGNKTKVTARERNLLEASAKVVATMVQNFDLIPVVKDGCSTTIPALSDFTCGSTFVFFEEHPAGKVGPPRKLEPGPFVGLEQILRLNFSQSVLIHRIGVSGLTIIIYKNYVVKLEVRPNVYEIETDPKTKFLRLSSPRKLKVTCQTKFSAGWGAYGRSYASDGFNVYYVSEAAKIVWFDMRTLQYSQTADPQPETDGGFQDFCLRKHQHKAFWALTVRGSIKYFEQFKLKYVVKVKAEEDLENMAVNRLMYTTIVCDSEYLVTSALIQNSNKNALTAFRMRRYGKSIVKIGTVVDAIPVNFENGNNCVHRMIFMYPKRYRILIAQNLFSLNSGFYVGSRGIFLLGTKRATNSSDFSNPSQCTMDDLPNTSD